MREIINANLLPLCEDFGIDYYKLEGSTDSEKVDGFLREIAGTGRSGDLVRVVMTRYGVELDPDLSKLLSRKPVLGSRVSVQGSGGIVGQHVTINATQVAAGDIHAEYNEGSFNAFVRLLEMTEREASINPISEAREITELVGEAVREAKSPAPDKKSILENLKKANTILDSITNTALKAGRLGSLLASAIKALAPF